MTTTELIPAMTERIVGHFDPLKIILFGSQARGDAGSHSDIDLLVVLPDGADAWRASSDIRGELRDLPGSHDVTVTTPEEIRRRGDLVGTVLRPALREGKVLYEREGSEHACEAAKVSEDEVYREVGQWLIIAEDDLADAQYILERPIGSVRNAGYFAQQAAEKALKAIFVYLQIQYPFTHNLGELRDKLPPGWRVKEEHPDLAELGKWAVEPRYPGGFAAVSREDVQAFVRQAEDLLARVLRDLAEHGYDRDRIP